uniref:Uncharacterized protein n=1 Tax=Panagrolaimus sp. PS1159 TaxID=55785 RepID=A0AC35GMX5_9BILA
MYSFAKQAKISAENSRNFTDFLLNIDPMIRLEKKAERRINEIMDLINGLKDMIHNLQFSVDIKYFNTQIKHPTKHLFQSVKRLLEYPSEYSKNALIQKCDDKSPLEILDVLNDVLSENWLIDQAAHVLMASPNVTLLIKKLDEIVEMLAISHAACSGAYSLEKLDFEKFTNISKKVFQQVERSKAFIHKNYLKFTESTVRKYLINFSDNGESDENKNYAKIANDLLSYFENFYNYGPLYTIGVSHMPTWFSNGMAHIGSEVEQSLLINEDSYSVYIILSPSLCDFHHKNETLSNLFESLINILAISQAACSGMHSREAAKLDFKKFTNISKKVFQQVQRSKAFIHQNYITYIEAVVKAILLVNSKENQSDSTWNINLAILLLKFLEERFNYGPLMTIGVGQNNFFSAEPMKHYGNFHEKFHFTINQNGSNIFFFLSPSLCDVHQKNETLSNLFESLINMSPAEHHRYMKLDKFKKKCGKDFVCAYSLGFQQTLYTGVYASNGGICRIGSKESRVIITLPFPQNYTYKPLESQFPYFSYSINHRNSDNFQFTNTGNNKANPSEIKYAHERLFMESNFNDIFENGELNIKLDSNNELSNEKLNNDYNAEKEKDDEVTLREDTFRLTSTTTTTKLFTTTTLKNNPPIKYSNFQAGKTYIFKGRVICNNGNPLGDDATVSLIEVDEYSPDDIYSTIN